jgi:hypothetical protein
MVMIRSQEFTNSLGVEAMCAPKRFKGSSLAGVRFQTVTEWPN